jgi:hypothetical protein
VCWAQPRRPRRRRCANFSYGELQSAVVGGSGCGTNSAAEPAIYVSRANNVFLGSELLTAELPRHRHQQHRCAAIRQRWATYTQISRVIPSTDYKATSNELGNLGIDHRNLPDSTGDFYAYQAFVAPSSSSRSNNNEAFLGVSSDGGHTWTDDPIPGSEASPTPDRNHNFPNVSVDSAGNVWYAWSDDKNVYTAEPTDHGVTWTCCNAVSTNTAQAIFPWLNNGRRSRPRLLRRAPTTSNQTWSVYFAQNIANACGAPQQLMAVHQGGVCETGAELHPGRQLFEDFGVDTDGSGGPASRSRRTAPASVPPEHPPDTSCRPAAPRRPAQQLTRTCGPPRDRATAAFSHLPAVIDPGLVNGQSGYSSLRQAFGTSGVVLGVRSSRKE